MYSLNPFHENIERMTLANDNFRQVVYTAPHCQIVLMSIGVGQEIGMEKHPKNDQFFRIEAGVGRAIVAGKNYELSDGVALMVPAGTEHNIINVGDIPLKLYTIYAPAHHIDGRVHVSKQDAISDKEDEEFVNS